MSFNNSGLPTGADRGDGNNPLPDTGLPYGTPNKNNQIEYDSPNGNNTTFVDQEHPDSPEIERGEQATFQHTFDVATWNEALDLLAQQGMGTINQDSGGNITKVLSSKIQPNSGGYATLVITAEGLNFDTPPDTVAITPVELDINILKHPRYLYALGAIQTDGTTDNANYLLNQQVIRALQNYFENPTSQFRDWLSYQLFYSIGFPGSIASGAATQAAAYTPAGQTVLVYPFTGSDMAKAAALEIITKYWRGEETPYIIGYQVRWRTYYYLPQPIHPGGIIEDPILQAAPPLPYYFWSTASPQDPTNTTDTIFALLASLNPQCYSQDGTSTGPVSISWLRKSDEYDYQRTWYAWDRTWFGAPFGHWDKDFYTSKNRPAVVTDYNQYQPDAYSIPSGYTPPTPN